MSLNAKRLPDPTDPHAGLNGRVPPVETRWQKGVSGNPAGRPRGARTSVEATFERELEALVDGDPLLDGDKRITRRTRVVRAVLSAVERGDAAAARLVFDRMWPIEASGKQQQVVVFIDAQDAEAVAAVDSEATVLHIDASDAKL